MTMTRAVHAIVAVLLLGSSTAAQPPGGRPATGSISGRVVDATSGRPIRWAIVRAVTQQGRQLVAGTDAQGRFVHDDLAAGRYTLDARAERYLPMHFGGTSNDGRSAVTGRPIVLDEGEHFEKADIAMPRAGAVEGRVVDEFGDPAPNITLQVSRLEYAAGRRRLMPVTGGLGRQPTDDRGHFRVYGLQPGNYYVSALSGAFTDQNEVGGFAPTYYPGTPDPASAQPVSIGYGRDALGVVISLVPAKMARVSGRVVDEKQYPVPGASMTMTLNDRLGISDFIVTRAVTGRDGTFTLRNVPPGSFTLQAFGRPPAGGPQNLAAASFGWLPVVVDGVDHTDLVLTVGPGSMLRGRIVLSGPSSGPPSPNEVRVATIPVEFDSAPVAGGPSPSVTRPDGTFEVSNQSGRRVVRVSTRSTEWMLKRLVLDGRDVTDAVLDFRKGDVDDLQVELTSLVSSVSGHVTGKDRQRLREYSVVLFATDNRKWTDRSRFILNARPAQDGRFRLTGVPPDDYLAIALPSVIGSEWQDPEFLETLRDRATPVRVSEGEAKQIELMLETRR